MKKKQIGNIVMVAVIVVVALAGILTVGQIQGWFDKDDGESAVLTQIRGIITIERDGVAYPAQNETILRPGDSIACGSGAASVIQIGESYLTLGENAGVVIGDPAVEAFCAAVSGGEIFVNATAPLTLSFSNREVAFSDTTALLSVRSGAQSISIFQGTVEDAQAGQIIDWVGDTVSVSSLRISSLNDFAMAQIRSANESKLLCFSNDDLDALIAQREAEMQAQLDQMTASQPSETEAPADPTEESQVSQPTWTTEEAPVEATTPETHPQQTEPAETTPAGTEPEETTPPETQPPETEAPVETTPPSVTEPEETTPASVTEPEETTPPSVTEPEETTHPETQPQQTEPPATEPPETVPPAETKPTESEPPQTEAPTTEPAETEPPATQAPTEPKTTCTITIRCDTILDNMDNLDPAKAGYVPSSGVILSTKTVAFTEGETVFDVLTRVCAAYGIQLEYSWTPMYDSYYIEGINNLYEFDCGSESGWMYKVNGWFPNYGCSSYTVKDGDNIVWCYTCNGLGADVGG